MVSSSLIDSQQSTCAQTDTNLKFPSQAKQHRLQRGNANADKWDMLLERRSIEELNEVLQEQLALLREGKLRLEGHYRKG